MYSFVIMACIILFDTLIFANKIKKKNCDLMVVMMSFLTILGLGALGAGMINALHIPITNNSILVIYVLITIGILLWKKQASVKLSFTISKYEVVFLLILFTMFSLLSVYIFNWELEWTYMNSDPAVHFKNAMEVYRNKKLNGMFFTSLFNSRIIEFFSCFLEEVKLYKAYIIADIFINFIESVFFFAIMHKNVMTKRDKFFLPISYFLFWMGYPLFSYVVGGYNYWGIGVVYCLYIVYWLERYVNEVENRKWIIVIICLGCFYVSISYMFFVPFVFGAVFVIVLKTHINLKFKIVEFMKLRVLIFLCLVCFALYYCFWGYFGGNIVSVLRAVGISGGRVEVFDPFLYMIPVLIVCLKYKEDVSVDVLRISIIVLIVNSILFGLLGLLGIISPYYYGKLYYPLWCCLWTWICRNLSKMNKYDMYYYAFLVLVSVGSIFLIEEKIENIRKGYIVNNEIELYSYNMEVLCDRSWDDNLFTAEKQELYSYVMDEIDERVIMLDNESLPHDVYFYEAITGDMSAQYCWWQNDDELFEKLESDDISYILVLNNGQFVEKNEDRLKNYQIVKENSGGCIYQIK